MKWRFIYNQFKQVLVFASDEDRSQHLSNVFEQLCTAGKDIFLVSKRQYRYCVIPWFFFFFGTCKTDILKTLSDACSQQMLSRWIGHVVFININVIFIVYWKVWDGVLLQKQSKFHFVEWFHRVQLCCIMTKQSLFLLNQIYKVKLKIHLIKKQRILLQWTPTPNISHRCIWL